MKKYRTIGGLLKAIGNGEACCLEYRYLSPTKEGFIIYQANGRDLNVTDKTYNKIEPYLEFV